MGELAKLSSTCLSFWGVPWREEEVLLCTCHTPQGDKQNSRGQGELSSGEPHLAGGGRALLDTQPLYHPTQKRLQLLERKN